MNDLFNWKYNFQYRWGPLNVKLPLYLIEHQLLSLNSRDTFSFAPSFAVSYKSNLGRMLRIEWKITFLSKEKYKQESCNTKSCIKCPLYRKLPTFFCSNRYK